MGGWVGSRPPIALKLAGKGAEIWTPAGQIGLLYEWKLSGDDGKWTAEAERYCFNGKATQVSVRFFYRIAADEIELRGEGHIDGEYAADGKTHRQPLKLRGTALAVA